MQRKRPEQKQPERDISRKILTYLGFVLAI